jgi:hypothetical protein
MKKLINHEVWDEENREYCLQQGEEVTVMSCKLDESMESGVSVEVSNSFGAVYQICAGFLKTAMFIAALLFSLSASAQVQQDKNGNYFVAAQVRDTVVTLESLTKTSTDTGKTFTDSKGNVSKVYKSKNGKLFTVRTSKNKKLYKFYL